MMTPSKNIIDVVFTLVVAIVIILPISRENAKKIVAQTFLPRKNNNFSDVVVVKNLDKDKYVIEL